MHGRFSDGHCHPISSARSQRGRFLCVPLGLSLSSTSSSTSIISSSEHVLLLAAAPRGEASGGSIAQPLWYIVNSIGVSMCYSSTWPALVFIHCCCASPTCVSSPSSACHGRWITGVVSPRTNVAILRQRRGEKCSLGQRLSDMLHHLAESTPMV